MSIQILADGLNVDSKKRIRSDLIIINDEKSSTIDFYELVNINNHKVLKVPFFYGLTTFNLRPCFNTPCKRFTFRGDLMINQGVDQSKIASEAIIQLMQYYTTTLILDTGIGKTVIACNISVNLGLKTLVYVPTEDLFRSWINTFSSMTDMRVYNNRAKYVQQDIVKDFDVFVEVIDSSKNIPSYLANECGTLILDEVHLLCVQKAVTGLLLTNPKYVVALSATPKRPDVQYKMWHLMVGEHSVIGRSERVPNICKVNTRIVPERRLGVNNKVDWSHLQHSLFENQQRNELICYLTNLHRDRRILILTEYQNHCDTLCNMLRERGESVDTMYGSKKEYDACRILCAGKKKVGTGWDEVSRSQNFCGARVSVLILCFSTKQPNVIIQCIGRVMRHENPIVYDLVDNDNITKSHWYIRKRTYIEKYNANLREYDPYTGSVKILNEAISNIEVPDECSLSSETLDRLCV